MRVLVSFVFTMTLILNQIEETPKSTKDESNHYCSHQNVHSLAIRRVFQLWVLPASLLPTWGIAPEPYYEGQSVLVYVGITSGVPRLVADVLVSDRSRVIIGTQDLRVNVSRREAFLAALAAAVPTGIFTSSKESLKLLMSRMWTGFELQHFHLTVLYYAV